VLKLLIYFFEKMQKSLGNWERLPLLMAGILYPLSPILTYNEVIHYCKRY